MSTLRILWKQARHLAGRAGLRTLFSAAYNVLLLTVALVWSIFVSRNRKIWLFGHNQGLFAGNSKYLFLWMSIHRRDLRAVWIAGDRKTCRIIRGQGFSAYPRWSLRGILVTLRAGAVFYCHGLGDVIGPLTRGAYLVNLWHGIGLKATEFGDKGSIVHRYKQRWPGLVGRIIFYDYLTAPDIVVTTSNFTQTHFSDQFRLPADRCPQLGYPRLDCVANKSIESRCIGMDQEQGFHFNEADCKRVYLYMPTWRETDRPFLEEALPDLAALNRILMSAEAILYIKPHPWTKESLGTEFSNIRIWPGAIEIYTYIDRLDILITDYSSVFYDYIFSHEAGIILYTFDFKRYLTYDRDLLYPFDENTAGLRIDTFVDLCEALKTGRALKPCPGIAEIRAKFWQNLTAPMSPAIVRYVENATGARRLGQMTDPGRSVRADR